MVANLHLFFLGRRSRVALFFSLVCHRFSSFVVLFFISGLYCTIEVDSFGHFASKAKTSVLDETTTTPATWNEVQSY